VTGLPADLVLRVGAAYSLAGEVYRAVAVRGAQVVAVSADPHGLDDLVDATTRVVDDPALTVLPAFADAHEHLLEAAKNRGLVPVEQARSVAEFAAAVGRAAAAAAAGQWVQTSMAWHESNLAEGRLPTRTELDAASPNHPVVARRGGHLAVANSAALGLAGITAATPDPPGGSIGHGEDGELSGVVEGAAVYRLLAFAPPPGRDQLVAGLRGRRRPTRRWASGRSARRWWMWTSSASTRRCRRPGRCTCGSGRCSASPTTLAPMPRSPCSRGSGSTAASGTTGCGCGG
jgi:predicted amidohydrolase YtcJ